MKFRKWVAILLLAAIAAGSAGCAENQIREMTDEELKDVGQFVAFTMMKYDVGHRSRLLDLPPVPQGGSAGNLPAETPAPVGKMDPVDDTPVVDNVPESQAPSGGSPAGEGQTEAVSSYSMEEVMGLPEGITVAFAGQEICDSYPKETDFFSVTARKGKKLLVLSFTITNALGQEAEVSLVDSGTVYRISVDGGRSQKALLTMMPNDLAVYEDTLAAGASGEAVLLIEIGEETESASSIVLTLKNESKTCTIQLQSGAQDSL